MKYNLPTSIFGAFVNSFIYFLIHPLICVFIYMFTGLIAGAAGAVRGQVRFNPVNRFIRVSTDHQILLINGITEAVVEMLKAGNLDTQTNFNVEQFSFDDERYQYNYVCS